MVLNHKLINKYILGVEVNNKNSGIKVITGSLCPDETIKEFNRRIAEIVSMKYSKEIIEEIISEYEKRSYSNSY